MNGLSTFNLRPVSMAIRASFVSSFEKQPKEVFYKQRCSLKFRKFHKKTPMWESLFHKVVGLRP